MYLCRKNTSVLCFDFSLPNQLTRIKQMKWKSTIYFFRVGGEKRSNLSMQSWTTLLATSARISEKVPIRNTSPPPWSIQSKKCERAVTIYKFDFTQVYRITSSDPNAHVSKRTHQLKYLVELAKANETRLNQLWSNAKQSSRTTAMKYGWWSLFLLFNGFPVTHEHLVTDNISFMSTWLSYHEHWDF